MIPDPVRPDSDVAVRVLAAFDDAAARAALHAGGRPVRELSIWIAPDSPYWSDVVDLLPNLPDDVDQLLIVAPVASVEIANAQASDADWPGRPNIPNWPHPRIVVARSTTPRPLPMWPEDIELLLELAGAEEAALRRRVEQLVPELRQVVEMWSGFIGMAVG